MLDLHRLRLLHHFSVHGSIANTAAALGYSASAVSQQLATLEREAGAALLDRTARSAVLTDVGHVLARHAADVLERVEVAEADLAAHAGRAVGRVDICAVPTAAVKLAPTLAALHLDEPAIELVVRQAGPAEALARLRSREADVAVIDAWTAAPSPDGLRHERLLRDPLVLAVPAAHPLADPRRAVDLGRASDERWICAPSSEPSRAAFDALMSANQVAATDLWEFEGLATIVALVGHGVGLAVVPALAVSSPPPEGVVVRRLPDAPARWIEAVTREASRHRPATAVTLDKLRDATAGSVAT